MSEQRQPRRGLLKKEKSRFALLKKNSRSTRFLIRNSGSHQYRYDESTEENHKSSDMIFFGKYAHIRKVLDYNYHENYTEKRQRLQNSIVDDMLDSALITDINGDVCTTPTEPWVVFTAGAMGAGKGYTINTLVKKKRFPLLAFVLVDPDEIRRLLPEYDLYCKSTPLQAGEFTRKEAGFVAEILTLAALQKGKNVLVDGSLRDSKWYQEYFGKLRKDNPSLRIGILHVIAPKEAVIKRAQERAELTGRYIPEKLLNEAMLQVPKSVKILAPLADYFCELNNPPQGEIEIVTTGETWESFQSKWLQTCAWVPGRRKKKIAELKASLSMDDRSNDRLPRIESFTLEEKRMASTRALKVVPRRPTLVCTFSVSKSTEESYKSDNMKFYGSYAHIRKTLDYKYHSNYSKKRQWLQDSVIEDVLVGVTGIDVNGVEGDTPTRPWVIFTAGSKGSGKRYTIDTSFENGNMPLVGFVTIDPDEVRNSIPEHVLYLFDDPDKANDLTRKEVRYISEITILAALQTGKNVVVDGCLKDTNWYKEFFATIREDFDSYRIAILHIFAPKETIYKRVERLGKENGKIIPRKTLDEYMLNTPKACETLKPYVDFYCELENTDDMIEIITEDIDWDSFRENWEQESAWEKKNNQDNFSSS